MNKIITTVLLVSLAMASQAQIVVKENFEVLSNWITSGNVVSSYSPSSSFPQDIDISPKFGTKMLDLNSSDYNYENNSFLKSPSFTLSGGSHFISFWSCRKWEGNSPVPHLEAYLKEIGTGTLTTVVNRSPSVQGEWVFDEMEVPASFNSTYELFIVNKGGNVYTSPAMIDDVVVAKNSVLSISKNNFSNTFKVYAYDYKIKLVSAINQENTQVSVVDLSGKVLLKNSYNLIKNNNITLDAENLSKGIYIVNISDGINSFSEKVLVQ